MAWLFPPIPSKLAHFSLKGVAWISPQLRTSNDHYKIWSLQARSFLSPAGGPIGLLLRASNEHILIVRVARARETNGLPDSLNLLYLPPPNL